MQQTTLCLLVRGEPPREVLLGYKKRGFGAGKYGGIGGKVEPGETPAQAAVRELAEETGVAACECDLRAMGHLSFLFPARPGWSQVMHVFLAGRWQGEPAESGELRPVWLDVRHLPFERMWPDARHWLPRVLAGEPVRLRFVYAADNETLAAGPEPEEADLGPPGDCDEAAPS